MKISVGVTIIYFHSFSVCVTLDQYDSKLMDGWMLASAFLTKFTI